MDYIHCRNSVNGSDDKIVLKKILKTFKDIPDDISIDVFGEIYEYFLCNFALAEGQGGGEFFTPSTVVRYMVEVLALTEGKMLDIITTKTIQFNDYKKDSLRGGKSFLGGISNLLKQQEVIWSKIMKYTNYYK